MWPDVFTPDLFTTTALTAAINEVPYQPGLLRDIGIFGVDGVSTLTVVIEREGAQLALVQTSKRGGPGVTQVADKRTALSFLIPHLKKQDAILADSVQGVRQFGTTDQQVTVEAARDKSLDRIARDLDFTLEYHRMGAIQGQVLDADGTTVLVDIFDAFDIAEPTPIDFDLDAASPASGAVMKKCNEVQYEMEEALDGIPYTGIHGICDNDFWDELTQHGEVRETFLFQQGQAAMLRESNINQPFEFGGITWHRYRGRGACAIPEGTARFVAAGVPDLFITRFGPADYIETVNTMGLPRYAKAEPMKMGRGIEVEGQSNPLNLCTRPQTLLSATKT